MNRSEARAAIAAVCESLDVFALVSAAPKRQLGGQSPVALISGTSVLEQPIARTVVQRTVGVQLEVGVRAAASQEATAEDQLDELVAQLLPALRAAGFRQTGPTTAQPYGAPLTEIDGHLYRMERITLEIQS